MQDVGLRTFGAPQYELIGDEDNSHGITVAADAAAHTKGSWIALGTSTLDADGFYLQVVPGTQPNVYLVDVAIGGAGSEVAILENLLASTPLNVGNWSLIYPVYVPLPIPAGTRLAARCQSITAGSDEVWASVVLARGEPFYAQRKSVATTYGADTANTGGTPVDPGTTAHTVGAWAEISASVNRIDYAIVCTGAENIQRDTASWFLDLGVGGSGSEVVNAPGAQLRTHSAIDHISPGAFERHAHWPAGSRLSARARSSIISATRVFELVVIGFS